MMESEDRTRQERDAALRRFLGKPVEVVVDRPMGTVHKGIWYPVNYGYLPGIPGGDGEDQDVYILGVEEPLARFSGVVIGAIRRLDDTEDKLVAAPAGARFHQGQIAFQTAFVEQYFQTEVLAVYEKSCGMIPYRLGPEGPELLLLHESRSGGWSFPKGHMEAGEEELDTLRRELREETGLRAQVDRAFRVTLDYPVSDCTRKEVVLYLGTVSGDIRLQHGEIARCRWLPPERAAVYLHPAYRPILERVRAYLAR